MRKKRSIGIVLSGVLAFVLAMARKSGTSE